MRVLDRYIIKSIGRSVVLVVAVLLTLLALFLFINEQGWVGVGTYGSLQALRYVLLNLPTTLAQLLPVTVLIGSLLAMGSLARGSELTVLRAAGVSIARIGLSALLAGLLLVPVALLLGEYLAPPLAQLARVDKAVARNADISVTSRSSVWIRQADHMLRADRHAGEAGLGTITRFELTDNQLLAVGQASGARQLADGEWELTGYAQSRFDPMQVSSSSGGRARLNLAASAAFLDVVARDPMEMSLRELHGAVGYLQANGHDTRHQRFAFWARIAGLAALPLAALLAVPFMFGSLRIAEPGARATFGLILGLAYFLLQRMVESGTLAFELEPMLLAFLPTLLLGAVVALLLLRVQRPTA